MIEPKARRTSGDGKSPPSSSKSSAARPSRIRAAVSDMPQPSKTITDVDFCVQLIKFLVLQFK